MVGLIKSNEMKTLSKYNFYIFTALILIEMYVYLYLI